MTRAEWEELWWREFYRRRLADPTRDLVLLHREVREWMTGRYGPEPAAERSGPPWWMTLGALAIGVPMGFLAKIWAFLNGKKTVFGAILTAMTVVVGYMPAVLAFFGVDAVHVAQYVGIATTVVGLAHKLWKLLWKEDHE